MWTSTLELNSRRALLTQLLGRFWRGAYFSSFAPFQVQNLPRQSLPASNWVRVRNRLAGICGSDLHLVYLDGELNVAPAAIPNHSIIYPGQEVVGEVIEVGEDVQHLQVGDRVVLQSGPSCLSAGIQPPCRSCAVGNYNLCEYGSFPGPQPIGGGWSEEMLLHEQQLFRISPKIADKQAVLLEPAAVALHAVLRHPPQPDSTILIIGAGTIGLLTLQVLRALFPQTKITVAIRYAFQVEQALRMGADHILYPQDDYEAVQFKTGAHLYKGMFGNKMLLGGYDVIYDTVGSKRTLQDALRWTHAGGTTVVVGINLHRMRIDLTPLWYQEVNLIGSFSHGMETWPLNSSERKSTFAIAAEMIESEQLHPELLITHEYTLNNYQQALKTATDKAHSQAIKVIFDYSKLPASVVPNVRASARQRRPTQQQENLVNLVPPPTNPPDLTTRPTSPLNHGSVNSSQQLQSDVQNVGAQSIDESIHTSSPATDAQSTTSAIQATADNTTESQSPEPIPASNKGAQFIVPPRLSLPATADDASEDIPTVVVAKPTNWETPPVPFDQSEEIATPISSKPASEESPATVVVAEPKHLKGNRLRKVYNSSENSQEFSSSTGEVVEQAQTVEQNLQIDTPSEEEEDGNQ